MTSPGLAAADTTPRRWGLPRGLIVLLGGAADGDHRRRSPGHGVADRSGVHGVDRRDRGVVGGGPDRRRQAAPHAGWADALLRASATKPFFFNDTATTE